MSDELIEKAREWLKQRHGQAARFVADPHEMADFAQQHASDVAARLEVAERAFQRIDDFQPSGEMMSELSVYVNMAAECKRIARQALSQIQEGE